MKVFWWQSGGTPARFDCPYRFEYIAAHAMIAVVEIYRRIAMRNDAGDDIAGLQFALALRIKNAALLVAEEKIIRAGRRATGDDRRTRIGCEGFDTRVGRYKSVAIVADHRGLHEERRLKRGAVAGLFPHVVILPVHEHIGSDLQFAEHMRIGIDV